MMDAGLLARGRALQRAAALGEGELAEKKQTAMMLLYKRQAGAEQPSLAACSQWRARAGQRCKRPRQTWTTASFDAPPPEFQIRDCGKPLHPPALPAGHSGAHSSTRPFCSDAAAALPWSHRGQRAQAGSADISGQPPSPQRRAPSPGSRPPRLSARFPPVCCVAGC